MNEQQFSASHALVLVQQHSEVEGIRLAQPVLSAVPVELPAAPHGLLTAPPAVVPYELRNARVERPAASHGPHATPPAIIPRDTPTVPVQLPFPPHVLHATSPAVIPCETCAVPVQLPFAPHDLHATPSFIVPRDTHVISAHLRAFGPGLRATFLAGALPKPHVSLLVSPLGKTTRVHFDQTLAIGNDVEERTCILFPSRNVRLQRFVRKFRYHMDLCSCTKKSQFCFGGLGLMCATGRVDAVSANFMSPGHTKFEPDRVAHKIIHFYNKEDSFNQAC